MFFTPDNFEVIEFYQYPTTVIHRIVEWDEGFHKGWSGMNEDVKDLFEELLEDTEKKLGRELNDNKIAMKVIYKPTNTEFFIGYKDWNWCLGLMVNPNFCGDRIVLR